MRFALATTTLAAVLAAPLAVEAMSPQMSRAEFLSAVACVAYENATAPSDELAATRWRLNAEAAKQPADVVAIAQQEARMIGAGARAPQTACGASRSADDARGARAV
jgi:hypothetical protein